MHFLGCQRCFEQVQLRQDMQATLARRPRNNAPWWAISAIAASLLVAAGAATWFRFRPVSLREGAPAASASAAHSAARPSINLTALAAISPPHYLQPRWRAAGQTSFDLGMQSYTGGDYAAATPGLLAALKGDPRNSAAGFFLGICYLMQGRDDAAIAQLKATIAIGDSPELEEAHFYLAKALLRRHDIAGAVVELREAVAQHGPRLAEEQSLLKDIQEARPAK
jgi:tetratricopeptide (TPR) repeat protein